MAASPITKTLKQRRHRFPLSFSETPHRVAYQSSPIRFPPRLTDFRYSESLACLALTLPAMAFPVLLHPGVLRRELMSALAAVLSHCLSRGGHATPRIFPRCNGLQVGRVDAGWITAKVVKLKACWHWADQGFVRETVCANHFRTVPRATTKEEGAVPQRSLRAKPLPAFLVVPTTNLAPKPLVKGQPMEGLEGVTIAAPVLIVNSAKALGGERLQTTRCGASFGVLPSLWHTVSISQ